MDTDNEELWAMIQQRLRDTRKRKRLLPQIKDARKRAIIRSMQLARLNHKALDNRYSTQRKEYKEAAQALNQLLTDYRKLAATELSHLKETQEKLQLKRKRCEMIDPNLIDHQATVAEALDKLESEMTSTLRPLREARPRS